MSVISDEVRKSFKENDDKRDEGLKTPSDVQRYDDIVYGEDSTWQVLDVYRPKGSKGKLPVIVSIHGGAWMYGDKERYQFYCMELARNGFTVVNFTYRLAPEFKFPAPLEDTKLVFDWIYANRDKYDFDISNVFALGDSAGAHTLSLYILMLTNDVYKRKLHDIYELNISDKVVTLGQCDKLKEFSENLVIKAVALNCGVYRLDEKELEKYIPEYMPEGGTADELKLLDIPSYITKEFPPAYLMTATEDFLRNQPVILAKEFTDKSVPFVYRMYGDSRNKLTHVFHCDIKSKDAKICNKDECEFFKSFI